MSTLTFNSISKYNQGKYRCLEINHVIFEDEGEYRCISGNGINHDLIKQVNLRIKGENFNQS